ncbi:MAG: SprT family zinc-dependent metalloprotease [Candidatus Zapsychrus exili]|nr:SprT family zinc-dependent metalloprotease [Candidatus Zapsychrus exili]
MRRGARFPKSIATTNRSIVTKDGEILFVFKKSFRKAIAISVDENSKVTVYAPKHSSDKSIFDFIRQKQAWIVHKQQDALKNKASVNSRKFEDGEKFLFLGKSFKLEVIEKEIKRTKMEFDGIHLKLFIPIGVVLAEKNKFIKEKLIKWYRLQADEILGGRLFYYSRIIGIEPKKISVRTQKRLWGNCDYNKQSINLNWHIILSPINVVDYVVVHELCHLLVPNHSKRFWNKVEKVLPNFQDHKKWLKTHAYDIMLP